MEASAPAGEPGVLTGGRAVGQQAGGLQVQGHVRQGELHRLEFLPGGARTGAWLWPGRGRASRQAWAIPRAWAAIPTRPRSRDPKAMGSPLAGRAEDGVLRDAAGGEGEVAGGGGLNAQLVPGADGEARGAPRDEEGGSPARAPHAGR